MDGRNAPLFKVNYISEVAWRHVKRVSVWKGKPPSMGLGSRDSVASSGHWDALACGVV